MQYNNANYYNMKTTFDTASLERKRRGRPCAIERRRNELIQLKFTSLINSGMSGDLAKYNVVPFIQKRQRRSKANDRERGRMGTLNNALDILKKHLPIDLYVFKL